MSYDTKQLVELAEQNPHNVLEIKLGGDNSIGAMGRTNVRVEESGDNFLEVTLLNFAQVKDLDNPEDERFVEEASYVDEYDDGAGASLWHDGRTYHLNTGEIASATPSNMLSRAEKKQ